MPRLSSPRRFASLSLACVVASSSLGLLALPPAAATAATQPAETISPTDTTTISSGQLRVDVATTFPQVLGYTDTTARARLDGTTARLTTITINGTEYTVTGTSAASGKDARDYVLTVPEFGNTVINARLSVTKNVVSFNVTEIKDTAEYQVKTLQLPRLSLVTVSSTQPGAQVSTANLSVDRSATGDEFTPITASTPLDAVAKSSAYALANTASLGAAVESNALYDTSSGPGAKDRGRFWRQAVSDGAGGVSMGLASGQWLYRAEGSDSTEELPWTRVAITADANADGGVDWQDVAIAMRSIQVSPNKGDQTPDNVITHIPFNFASQATHPFLRTLDDVKRISLATDGLGQVAMLKGYTSEGHDSANTDYGNNFNTRAGGLEDLNKLVKEGKDWNASFGVHINATEIYPEAKSFSEDLLRADKGLGWNWLDQSYYINQRQDINSGKLAQRIKELREATDKNLDFVYVDVYYEFGWLAERLQQELVKNGFRVGSEWADHLSRNNTWSHWANDEKYGGSTNKGINSQILRFINNTQSDVWNPDPKLGVSHIVEFEGWTGQNDFNAFSENVWTANLPAKFLQHHPITKWTADRIDLADGVAVTGNTAAERNITVGGASVLQGGTYLLPWSSKEDGKADKLYHYNPAGGASTWTLTKEFAKSGTLELFKLTDNGRVKVADVPVVNGQVTITSEAKQPYVLTAKNNALPKKADFGEGTAFNDPGFNGADLSSWNPMGSVTQVRDDKGRRYAQMGATPSSISQEVKLDAGTQSVSAWVEVQPGKTRPTTLSVDINGKTESTTIDSSNAENYVAGDEKHGTSFQRVRVLVDVPRNNTKATVSLKAADGDATVRVDDFRAVKTTRVATTGVLSEDFENVDQGWGPFVKGDAGGSTDPRTHITERNEPFTQKGWNTNVIDEVLGGNWSLIAHDENLGPNGGPGMVYRTTEATMPFQAGHKYKVSFDYQNSKAGQYAWVSGYDSQAGPAVTGSQAIDAATSTTRFEQTLDTGFCGDYFVGLQRTGSSNGSDFTLDNLLVEDLGASEAVPACAQLSATLQGDVVQQGKAQDFVTTFVSDEPAAISNLAVALDMPEGWTATPSTPATAPTLAAGGTLTTTWKITAPASADGDYPIKATASYTTTTEPAGGRTIATTTTVRTLPKPPQATVYASDHPWVSATNGWGPVEKDQSNGGTGTGDGTPLTLNGTVYAKGLGAHANGNVRYYLGGYCTAFTATVGIDDAQATRGSVKFSVVADGATKVTTPVLGATSAPLPLTVDVTGAQYVELVADDAGDSNGNDHADWADAKFTCSATAQEPPAPVLTGTVFASDLPWIGSSNGWGPAERDRANGEQNAGDGPALRLDGVVYPKGIGVHADSKISIATEAKCTVFKALVGVDDAKLNKGLHGSVVFIVKGDGRELLRTPVLSADSAALPLNVDITGVRNVELIADKNGDDAGDDWGDWADAKFSCA
ncbi:endo-alpha-N-acetylgalactosaminidase family protein [Paenarthrobacter nitroguajacolicus]|uniref:endo-alpha-N-acetylgalactosaminidase family protein n=1 Tax=Paenarthrobacter nitroguajacolicus TaxID=211146 RepID=UPI00285F8297|nr:endo-alpha-N-acetylgalactosaminidase family protein [Paenarthrobacter nitroguajacolicus]MDR6637688.1 endo-alpha-N-acetylgalactosaminidase [Paenarthrobacter nitroguajacolicus]